MSGDPGDLANMADLALPAAISFWPPAAGVWIVGGTAAAMLAIAAGRALARYRADAYLRRARAELGRVSSIEQVSAVLKRAAIVAYGRERVASLTGAQWTAFLAATGQGVAMEGLAASLDDWSRSASGTSVPEAALAQSRAWLSAQRGRAAREA